MDMPIHSWIRLSTHGYACLGMDTHVVPMTTCLNGRPILNDLNVPREPTGGDDQGLA